MLDNRLFRIGANLADAFEVILKNVKKSQMALWVDAICINQVDLLERAAQVQMMSSIFSRSQRNYAWFGKPTEDSDRAIAKTRAFRTRWALVPSEWRVGWRSYFWSAFIEGFIGARDSGLRDWKALSAFFQRDWFGRVWIVQEATCPVDLLLFCGKASIDWPDIEAMVQSFMIAQVFWDSEPSPGWHANVLHLRNVHSSRQYGPQLPLSDMLWISRRLDCKDARDRVYAMLSIASDLESPIVCPGYAAPIHKVCVDIARSLIVEASNLAYIGLIEPRYSHTAYTMVMNKRITPSNISRGSPLRNKDLLFGYEGSLFPTWVPDLRISEGIGYFKKNLPRSHGVIEKLYAADRNETPDINFRSSKLIVKGFAFDRIACRRFLGVHEMLKADPEKLERWVKDFDAAFPKPYPTSQSTLAATLYTMAAGIHYDARGWVRRWSPENLETMYLDKILGPASTKDDDVTRSIRLHIGFNITYWGMAWTAKGYIGLIPKYASIGDKVCVLYGGQMLYVLRQDRFNPSLHEMIGESYFHGLVDGEAFEFLKNGTAKEEMFLIR